MMVLFLFSSCFTVQCPQIGLSLVLTVVIGGCAPRALFLFPNACQVLNLADNESALHVGARAICRAIHACPMLQVLALSRCKLGQKGGIAIVSEPSPLQS
jgi:hypothetical protein